MGKQNNSVTYVSQAKFDKDLNSSVDILIADGADDNTIKEYIQDYKSRFAVAEKKNSVSNGTSEAPQSESQQPQKKASSLSVGGKPIQTGGSESSVGVSKKDLISKFGIKPGEKIQGAEKKAYEAQRNIPKVGTTKSKPVVSTKPVSETLTKQVEEKYETLSKIPTVTEKLEEGVKLSPDELLTISKQQDLVINQNYDPSISQKKLDDELNEYQFLDGISEGIRSSTNKFFLQPLTEVNKFFGGDKDFTIKKGIPLANEMEEAEKELISEKGIGNFSKEDVSEKAKSIFLKNDEMSQKKNATDAYFSSLPEGHSVQRELEIKKKSDVFKLNEDVKKTVQLKQLNDDRILAYNQFLLDIDKKGFATEEDKIKGQELFNLAKKAEEDNVFLRKEYLSNMSKLQKDEEKLELLKYNYNDLDKTREILNNFFKETIGGGLKLLGETREFVFEQTIGRVIDSQYEDPLSIAGDYVMDIGKEWKKGKPEFRMMTLDDVNNWSDAGSWLGQTATEQTGVAAALSIGGPIGLEIISAGSGGAKIKQMEESGKDYSQLQKVLSGWAYYGAEKYTEKYSTFKYIEDLKGSLNTISKESRNLAEKEFKKEVGKVFAGTLAQTQIGAGSEALSSLSNSISDIFINGDKMSSSDIAKNMKEAYAAGLVMDGGISSFGALSTFASRELRAISDNKDIKDVREIIDRVESINKELNTNLLLTDSDKKTLQDKANSLSEKAVKIVAKSVDNVGKLSEKEITELLDINKEQSELKSKLNELNKSAMSSDLKKDQYNDLNSRFIALEEKRNDILKGTYNEFNYLPEEEQTKFKTQAAEAIIQEQLDKGVERDNIQEPNPEVINKKAIEIYESNKQTTGQVSEQEKPTTATEAETTDTTQQETELQSQEEVSTTPKTEKESSVKEDEIIEIPEDELEALRQEVEEQKIEGSLSDNIGQKGYIGSKEGMIKIDDTNQNTIVFETNNEIIELGKVDEDSNKSIASFGISKFPQEGVRTEAKKGTSIPVVKIDGKEYEFVSRARDKKGKAVVKLKEKETGLIRRLSGEKAERILKDVALQSDKKEVKLNLKVSGKEVQTQEKTQKELKAEQKKRNSEERRKRREEFQVKTLEELKQEEKKSEELLAKIEEEILDELVKKSKNKDLVKVGQRIFQVTKKQDGTFSVSQVNTEGKLVGIRDEDTRNKAIGVFKAKKTKADKKDLEEAQKLIDDFRKDERDRIEKLLDKAINTLDLQGKGAFDASIAIPAYAAKKFLEGIKVSYKAGKTLAEAINDGIKLIRNMGYTTISDFDLKEYALKQLSTKKETKDAVQKQITDEGVLQPKQSEMGLQEMEQGDQVNQEPTEQGEEKVSKVTPIKEVKDQLQDLFSAAKEAVRITKNKAKEINKLKNDLNQFVTANLVGLDASDIGKASIKSINSAIQKTNDVNFEEQVEKINDIIDDLYLRKELKDEKVLDKKIEEMSKDTFYKDKTSSKVTKTKVTDAFKKKIEEAKKNFAKINNPLIADKTAFAIEMNNLYKQGLAERKKVDEAERSRSKENASKLSIFALKKDGRVDDKKRIGLGSKNVDDAFKKGGVIYNGNIYLNTEKGRSDFARDTDGLDSVIVNSISTPVTASGSEMVRNQNSGMLRGVSKYIKDLKRRYSTATFSAERFFSPFYTVKGAKEFIENNWNNKLKVYSERIGRQISEFKDVRDEFLSDVLGKELLSKRKWWAKSKTASRIAAELAILRAEKSGKDPLSAFVSKNNIRFEVDMLDDTNVLSFQEAIGVFDTKIKEETNPDKAAKLKQQKEEFINKYIAFEGMTNEGVAALFNMLRQPEGFNKFLNSFSVKDALAIVNYVQDNQKIREIADKSSKMFESIRDYVNPTLDKLGYDTLGESNYISKEDALSAMEGKDTKRTEGFYEMLDIIYPDGIPDKVPYFPLSAEGLSGTNESNVLEFFEDTENPNADYSLLFPSLFTRKSGGNLNLQNLTIESVFDKVSKEAVTMVNGVDIASDLRNLYANEGNNVAMLNAFGRGWNEQFKKKVLNIIKDDAYESALNQNDVVGKGLKVWITSRSLQRAAQLAFNMFSAFSQIFGTGVAYSKGDNLRYLKDTMKNLASTSKRKAEIERLSSAYNAIVNSKNYKERVNKRRDNADVAAVKSVKEKTGFALAGDILSDMLFLTTIADQLSVMSLAPIYAGKYANIDGISEAEKVDEFFAEEVNKTLQSNAPYYTGTAFYNKWSLALGVGGYLQSPRQGMELILNETESILRKEGDYKKRTARIIALMSFSAILPTIFKDVLRGSDDDEEDEKSKADKKTEALQVTNKIGDAILESTGLGGSTISAIKNATLIKTSPEIMEMDLSPSDVKASDMIMQLIKGASPNLSITLRNIDNVIDNKGIYSTQDQLAYGIETGVGFPAAQFKKQMDYLSALGSEYYDFYDYLDLVSGKVSQAEFKKFEKEISNLTETLDKVIYPYETKEGALNTSFLNKKQINELSKMSLEQKANYVEEIRLMLINKAVVEQVEMYKKGSDGIDKSKGFYKVRESKFKNELSDMIYDLLKNKYYSEDNAINVEDLKTKLIEFRKDNNISAKSSVDIFKESYKKAEQKMIEEVTIPLIKKIKDYNKGRDRAKFLYDAIGDMQYEDRFRYIKMIGEEFDEETQIEYVNILKNKQERGE